MTSDKRRFPRVSVAGDARYKVPTQMDISMASIKNISEGGICLLTSEDISHDQAVTLEFGIPNARDIVAQGKVAWREVLTKEDRGYRFQIGVQFVDIDDAKRDAIRKFVIARLKALVREEMKPVLTPGAEKKKILVIDDDRVMLTMVQQIFKNDFDVLTASDGHEGIEIARKSRPNIILLDLVMPSLDGFSTLALLKDFKETKDIPVIILSVIREKSKIFQAMQHGASDYVLKPFTGEKLVTKIRKIVFGN